MIKKLNINTITFLKTKKSLQKIKIFLNQPSKMI